MHSLFELFLQWTPVVDEKEVSSISHNYKLVHNYDSILHLSHTSPSSILISTFISSDRFSDKRLRCLRKEFILTYQC